MSQRRLEFVPSQERDIEKEFDKKSLQMLREKKITKNFANVAYSRHFKEDNYK